MSMNEVNPVIVEKGYQPRISLRNALCFDAMIFGHVNDERMRRDKAELQRNLTRFVDFQNASVLNRVVALPYASPYGFVRSESQWTLLVAAVADMHLVRFVQPNVRLRAYSMLRQSSIPFHMLFVAVAASNSSWSNHPSAHSNICTRSRRSRSLMVFRNSA